MLPDWQDAAFNYDTSANMMKLYLLAMAKINRAFKEWCRRLDHYMWHMQPHRFDLSKFTDVELVRCVNALHEEIATILKFRNISPKNAFIANRTTQELAAVARELRKRHPNIQADQLLTWIGLLL